MLRKLFRNLMPACVMLLSAAFAYGEARDGEGIVRLGRRKASKAPCDACTLAPGQYGIVNGPSGTLCPGGGVCPDGNCQYGYGMCGYGSACGHCGCHEKLCHVLHWLSPYHGGCTYPPDHGWAPPLKKPMNGYATGEPGSVGRVPVRYTRYFPAHWTGEQSWARPGFRYPMVYMPTDTTQLGYYYQQVPTWSRNVAMVPPVPNPAEWHTPDFSGGCGGCCGSGAGHACPAAWDCPEGGFVSDDVIHDPTRPALGYPIPGEGVGPAIEGPADAPAQPYAPAPSEAPEIPADASLEKTTAAPALEPVPLQ